MLYKTTLERLAGNNHSSLLKPYVSYEENEELWIQPLISNFYYKKNIFLLYKTTYFYEEVNSTEPVAYWAYS
jgi:hypothetical protein